VTSAGAKSGDALLLAGSLAIEGTAILAREHAPALRTHGVREQVIRDGAALLDRPGISVLPAVRALTAAAVPHAMHDPTEGGLLAAARELAEASGVGLRLEVDRIPILPACAAVCEALQLDPLRLLASGSLLAAVTPEAAGAALAALRDAGLDGASVGTVLPPGAGTMIVRAGVEEPLPAVERDELARWEESQGG
jgi:hydrogenase expression/formation protein HypE